MNSNDLSHRFECLLGAGQGHLLRHGLKGLEKESLRLSSGGSIAQTPHPPGLGSALTHPGITTDYSEALIELITPPFADPAATLSYLEDLHTFVYRHLDEEFLLASSMPCGLDGDESIPIARYGSSNIGQMKHVYRCGLAWRYGRSMQAIAGVHFNYSVNEALWPVLRELEIAPESPRKFVDAAYFGMVRNVHRFGWLPIYLFGMSPAVDKSFFRGRESLAARFPEFDEHTLYRPYATSLRMSDIGYRNDNQSGLDISFDDLDSYVASLSRAIATPYADYERIGVRGEDGEYRQLNGNILQIENEYYSAIRPKQVAVSGEKPTLALRRRGVRYLELRCLDLGLFDPAGVSLERLCFLEVFLLYCLLLESPSLLAEEKRICAHNGLVVACCGRTDGFRLQRVNPAGEMDEVSLREWGEQMLESMQRIAEVLDAEDPDRLYSRSVRSQREVVADPELTPAYRIMHTLGQTGESIAEFSLKLSHQHAAYFHGRKQAADTVAAFRAEADQSLAEQARIEAADTLPFEEFLQRYFAQA